MACGPSQTLHEYWKDPETKLTLHKLPHLTDEQFHELVKVTRKHADGVVAYTLQQHNGVPGSRTPVGYRTRYQQTNIPTPKAELLLRRVRHLR
jgi:hypothetical protein